MKTLLPLRKYNVGVASLTAAGSLIVVCILLLLRSNETFWLSLRDYGSAYAGLLALSAGVMTIFASDRAIQDRRLATDEARRERLRFLTDVIIAELQGVWNAIDACGVVTLYRASIEDDEAGRTVEPRRYCYVRGEWLRVREADPSSLGYFPYPIPGLLTDVYARTASVVGRINWLNDRPIKKEEWSWVRNFQKEVLVELDELRSSTLALLQRLAAIGPHLVGGERPQ